MKIASLAFLTLVLVPAGLIASCASGGSNEGAGGGGVGGAGGSTIDGVTSSTGDTTTGDTSSSTGDGTSSSTGGGVCVPKCTTDVECQNSCPSGGTNPNCCDQMTGTCYVSTTAACPLPKPDGGTMMPPY